MSASQPVQLPIMFVGEHRVVSANFAKQLASGVGLTGTPTVVATVLSGTDASPQTIVSGSASIVGTRVLQMIVPTAGAVTYELTYTVTTDAATPETLVEVLKLPVEAP